MKSISEQIASNASKLLNSLMSGQDYYATLSNSTLSLATTYFQDGHYERAIQAFRQTIALSPNSDNAATAYQLMADAYKALGKTDEEIKTLKQASSMFPESDTFHLKLGNIYYEQGKYADAENEYLKAVRLNPNVEENEYALGQAYLAQGKYNGAETQFKKVIRLSPRDASGYYSLGQTYHKTGNYEAAIEQFKKALSINSGYADVYIEMGKTYVDMSEFDKANDTLTALKGKDSTAANTLKSYINQKTSPAFIAAYSLTGFNSFLGAKSPLSSVNSYLATPNATKTFTMSFTFSKDMDLGSVLNIGNWSITKATGSEGVGVYNAGLISASDTNVNSIPLSVTYDQETRTATITFRLTQNSEGNATIDTSHLIFKFSGTDKYGNKMDVKADQYCGVSQFI